MKAELTKDGFIKVTAETITEAWALNACWPSELEEKNKNQDRVIIDCSILMIPPKEEMIGYGC